VKESKNESTPAKRWQKTQYSNLIRYVPSGIYFARFRVSGKLIWRSLKTDAVSVAKMRLGDLEKAEQERAASADGVRKGKVTGEDAIRIYLERVEGDRSLKPRTKDYHRERIGSLKRSWPGFDRTEVRKLTKTDCLDWAARIGRDLSPSAFNHTIGILRKVIDVGVELGARYDNPASHIKRLSERGKKLTLPTADQFEVFVKAIETSGSGFSKPCSELVRFLAYGGFRINEARNVIWAHCNFEKGEIVVYGDPETGTKGAGHERRVPMIGEMTDLLLRMRSERPEESLDTPVMRVRECQKAMNRAAEIAGMKRITHHDLRHLFATRCIESGVDIPTVSRWLGHKDGGALAMRVYGHLRDQHSTEMAKRVSFSNPAAENVVPMPKEVAL
jgi:integrase